MLPFLFCVFGLICSNVFTHSEAKSCMETVDTAERTFYPTTIWSEVERAGQPSGTGASIAALERLLKNYYRPLQTHLAVKFRVNEDHAADWLQEFVCRKVLLGELLATASRARGRFRTFLLNALDNFVLSEQRRQNAQIRCPAGGLVSIEEAAFGEIPELPTPKERSFDLEWARTVLARVVTRMEGECQDKGRLDRWGVFKARLLDPMLDGADVPGYEDLVARFGFQSPAEASNALITAKRQFDRLLREVVAEYAGEGADVEAEIVELRRALSEAS
jgi:hypothetical protein